MYLHCLYEECIQNVTIKMVCMSKSFEFVTYESGEEIITEGTQMRMMMMIVMMMMVMMMMVRVMMMRVQ